jgi:50S ribosomal subunit-associated GTPase HflX
VGAEAARVERGTDGIAAQAWVSASTGAGLEELCAAIAQAVGPNLLRSKLHLGMRAAAVRSELFQRDAVRGERQCDDGSWELDVELEAAELAKLLGRPDVELIPPSEASLEQRVA